MLGWLSRLFSRPPASEPFGRSGAWPRVRREHLGRESSCIACGRSGSLELHHVVPYHDRPDMELDPENLVTLCGDPCHLVFGHLLDWRRSNPHVREDAAAYLSRMRGA